MPQDSILFMEGALAMIVATCATYLTLVFYTQSYVSAACRVNIARQYIVLLLLLMAYLLYRGWVVLPAVSVVTVVVILVIFVILATLILQNGIPGYNAHKKTKVIINHVSDLFTILTGRPPAASGEKSIFDYYFGPFQVLTGQPPLDRAKLLALAELLKKVKDDRDAGYDVAAAAQWVREKGLAKQVGDELTRLLEAIDAELARDDLTPEEREKLRALREEIEKMKRALAENAGGAGAGSATPGD